MIEKKDPNQKIVEDDISDDDPIIELTDEVTTNPEDDRKDASPGIDDFIPPKEDKNLSFGIDEGIIVFEENEKSELQDNLFTGVDDQISDDDNGIDMPADIEFEREEGEEIIPLAELGNNDVETDDDIIEISEFDQHFPDDEEEEDEEAFAHADLLEPSGLADEDFLELFDIEDEGPMEDEELRELSESEEKAVETELSRFFDDTSEDETGIENNAPQPVEKFSELGTDSDLAMAAAALSSGAGKFNRPDTPFPQNPSIENEAASLPKDQFEKNEHMLKDSAASNASGSPVVSPEQIDQTIERIINEKLAGRIEHIIYEIIEKAVKREIDRLKESLLDDSTSDDNL
jgi:hypothetical protein